MSCKLWAPEGGSSFLYLPLYRAKMIWYEIDDIYDICVFCVAFPALRLSLRQTGPRPPVPPPTSPAFRSFPWNFTMLCVPFVHPHLLIRKNNNNNIIKETLSTQTLIKHIQHYHHCKLSDLIWFLVECAATGATRREWTNGGGAKRRKLILKV